MVLSLDSTLEERTQPFQLFRGRDLLDGDQLEQLLATMPTADVAKIAVEDPKHEKQYRMNLVDLVVLEKDAPVYERLPEIWRDLVEDLRGAEFTAWLEAATGIELAGLERSIGLYTHRNGDYLSVHKDKPTKAITVILYLNRDWPVEAGGQFQIFDSPRSSPTEEISPVGGQLLAFPPTDKSWHAVSKIEHPEGTERITVQIEYWLTTGLAGSAYRPQS
ncbi:2OG-Fe(II) oxygenase [Streptomyces sp. NPDC004539]|uniref:prolyl hydroxylase family protein n=1 Tax=Streptomyces sp. NPDC004539 TaxID=3154280 RepID=UPI0033BED401